MDSHKLFVDTWGWVTHTSQREKYHQQVSKLLSDFRGQVFTSDYILDETITLLYARYPQQAEVAVRELFALIAGRYITLERITDERFEAAWQLRQRYADKPAISFTDLTSVVVMQERNIAEILTHDAHFMHVGLGLQLVPVPN